MIGCDHDRTLLRDAFALDVIDQPAAVESRQCGFDERKTSQVGVLSKKVVDIAKPRKTPQRSHQGTRDRRAPTTKPVGKAICEGTLEVQHRRASGIVLGRESDPLPGRAGFRQRSLVCQAGNRSVTPPATPPPERQGHLPPSTLDSPTNAATMRGFFSSFHPHTGIQRR
jgi:hypothetical protein